MAKNAKVVREVFRGISRMNDSYRLSLGPVRADGLPALLLAVTGIVLAGGIATALARNAERLPETLREARGLAESLRQRKALNP